MDLGSRNYNIVDPRKTNILSIGFASQCSDIMILCFFESVLCLKIFVNKTDPECKIVPRLSTVLVLAMYQ